MLSTLRLVRLGREMPNSRVTAALTDVERTHPQSADILRAELNRLQADVQDLGAGRMDVYLARMLADVASKLATVGLDMNNHTREARTLLDRLLPIVERVAATEAHDHTEVVERHRAEGERHRAAIETQRLMVERLKSRDKVLIAAIPLAMLIGSFLTWLVTDGKFSG